MSDPIDRAAEAPRILGVEMRFEPHRWYLNFGTINVGIGEYRDDKPRCATLGGKCVAHQLSLPDCIAAIERELLAIKSAIPDRACGPRFCLKHGGYGFDSDCVACSANETVGHPEYTPEAEGVLRPEAKKWLEAERARKDGK